MEHQVEAILDSVPFSLTNNSESDSKLLDIKIEIGSEIEESITIAENIKNVIETNLGNEKDLEESSGLRGSNGNSLEAVKSKESVDNVVDTHVDLISKNSLKLENYLEEDYEVYNGPSESLAEDVHKEPEDPDSYNIEINDSTIIPSSDISLSSVVELEELTTGNSEILDLKQHQDEKMGLLTKAMKRIKNLPLPGSDICKDFSNILSLYSEFLSPATLSEMSPAKCGLCYEEFTSERYTWKHYTGNNHKLMMEKLINGRYQEYCPSYFTMVMEAVYSAHPNHVTERQILEIIKSKFGEVLGQDDKRKMALIRTKGLDKLIQSEYIMREPDDFFSVTEHLIHRKRRIKKMLENYQRNVTDKDVSGEKDNGIKKDKLFNQDPSQFRQQIIDLSSNDLPPEIVDTLLLGRCGLCKLEIFCKPWSHYTGPGHRTMVDIYKEGGYLGHPPYPTMIDTYMKQEKPDNLVEEDVIEFIKKNFNVGEDPEKVQKRVEVALATISRKKCTNLVLKRGDVAPDTKSQKKSANAERKSPSNHLVWFKKSYDKSEDKGDIKPTLPVEQDGVTKTWSNGKSLTRGRGHGNSFLSRDGEFSSQKNTNYEEDPQSAKVKDLWDIKEKEVTAWKKRSDDYSRVNQYEINKRKCNYRDIDVRRKGEVDIITKGHLKRDVGEERAKFVNGDDKYNGDKNNKMAFNYSNRDPRQMHRVKDSHSKPRKDYVDPSKMPIHNRYGQNEKKKRKSSPISHHTKNDSDGSKYSKIDSDAKFSVEYESRMKRSSGPNEHHTSSRCAREVGPSNRRQSEIHDKSRSGSSEKRRNRFKDRRHEGSQDVRLSGSQYRKDCVSKERYRSGSHEKRRSGSQDRSPSRVGDRKHGGSRERSNSESRDRRNSGSREGRNSGSRVGRNSGSRVGRNSGSREVRNRGSRDERNIGSRDERNSESRDGRKSGSYDRRNRIGSKERRRSGSKVKRPGSSQSSKSPMLDIIPEKDSNRGSLLSPNPPVIVQQSLPVTSNLQFQQLQATSVLQQSQQPSFLSQHPQFPHIFILTQQPQTTTNPIIQPINF